MSLIVGPAGAVVVLIVAVYSLARAQIVVPGPMHAASEHRNKILENENIKQQDLLTQQAEQLSEQRVTNARLEERIKHLSTQVETLTAEVSHLRSGLET